MLSSISHSRGPGLGLGRGVGGGGEQTEETHGHLVAAPSRHHHTSFGFIPFLNFAESCVRYRLRSDVSDVYDALGRLKSADGVEKYDYTR